MSNTPQPGRIPPMQLPDKIPGGMSSAGNAMSSAKGLAENPTGAISEKALGAVTEHFVDSDNKKRLKKALNKAHRTGRVPIEPKYRISLFEGGLLVGVCIVVDIIDWIVGLFCETGIGELILMLIDLIFGIILAAYCRFRLRLAIGSHLPIYISIVAAELIGNIPLINAFWWLDGWYIFYTLRSDDRKTHQQLVQTIEQERQEEERQNWMEQYQKQQVVDAGQDQTTNEEELPEQTENGQEGRIKPKKPAFQTNNSAQWRQNSPTNTNGTGRFVASGGIIK